MLTHGPHSLCSVTLQAARALRGGGCCLFRDYGLYDLSQLRSRARIAASQYVREVSRTALDYKTVSVSL